MMRVLTIASTILFAIFGLNDAFSTRAEAADLGKIMPLGDSITLGTGSTGTAGYRQPLYEILTEANHSFEFVGSLTTCPGSLPTEQVHHEGHSGYVISSGTSGRGGIADNIATWLGPSGVSPDIILLMIGTNDIASDYECATAPDRLSSLISTISNKATGLAPDAKLIVAQITPVVLPAINEKVVAFNGSVAGVVAAHHALGENVSLVNMYSVLDVSMDFSDSVHPDISGYEKMAQVWSNAIQMVDRQAVVGDYVYTFENVIGSPAGPVLDGQDNWVSGSSNVVIYDNLSNNGFDANAVCFDGNGGWAYRDNDENWSFTIPEASAFTVEWTARIGNVDRYAALALGAGGNSDMAFRMWGGGSDGWRFRDATPTGDPVYSTDNHATTNDEGWRISLSIDLAANDGDGAASLSTGLIASDGSYTLVPVSGMQNMNMDLTNASFVGADGLSDGLKGADLNTLFIRGLGAGAIDDIAISITPILGDANGDGKVDGSDVTILAGNWQAGVGNPDPTTITWAMGDFNGDGQVDGSDVTILAGNWQCGVTSVASAVPEPSMIVLLAIITGSLLLWRRVC